MARIRSIKPEFWTSEQVVECSPTVRLLFIGLWNFCDDHGIHPASCLRLKMEVFPGDKCTERQIASWVGQLVKVGLLKSYVVDGKEFWIVTGWKHQKIEKPTYLYPLPQFGDQSPNGSGTVADHSTPESSRVESIGEEEVCTETLLVSVPPYRLFPCDGIPKEFLLTDLKIIQYRETFPNLDVEAECRKAWQWCQDNPTKRKTARGIPAFLTRWLGRAQNSKREFGSPEPAPIHEAPYPEY
jgi:hypothetical protein